MGTSEEKGTVKKFWLWALFAAIGGVLLAIAEVLLARKQYDQDPSFAPLKDKTEVKTSSGDVVKLPETKSEGQLTSDKVKAVAVEKENTGHVEVVKQTIADVNSVGSPVAGSAGEMLFGKRQPTPSNVDN